jgi:Asp-tRNA(Asn)/Glu-tRNA(Gln) amidotransferase A subunit family amidase
MPQHLVALLRLAAPSGAVAAVVIGLVIVGCSRAMAHYRARVMGRQLRCDECPNCATQRRSTGIERLSAAHPACVRLRSADMERRISAATLASQVANGQISAVELVRARLELAQRLNPGLNALVVARAEAALGEAGAIDIARLRGEALGPLAGVPITIKEALDVQGLPSTGGLRQRAAHRADSGCAAVARLRGAGAVILGKSNLAQAMVFIESDNPHFGRTQHPERADRSPGGSSGGEGALIASGISTLGLGTDIGGSARIPAAF